MEETTVPSGRRPEGVSTGRLVLPVTGLSRQQPHRKGNCPSPGAWPSFPQGSGWSGQRASADISDHV